MNYNCIINLFGIMLVDCFQINYYNIENKPIKIYIRDSTSNF